MLRYIFLFFLFSPRLYCFEEDEEYEDETCQVCVKFLKRFADTLSDEDGTSSEQIGYNLKEHCKITDGPENRFCYYVGALEESASTILHHVSKPMSWGMPVKRICSKLREKDEQICELRYPKPVNFARDFLMSLKIKDLRNILTGLNGQCQRCTEKIDYVKVIESFKPKPVPKEEL